MAIERGNSIPRRGMNRDSHPSELSQEEYVFALNTNIFDENGNGSVLLQNESSNYKCSGFKPGYRVIGHKFDQNNDRVYFFLHNTSTECSEIGYIDILKKFEGLEAFDKECGCNIKVVLETPLEDVDQVEYCEYNTLLSDCCPDFPNAPKCLNFRIDHPIHESNVEIKDERSGIRMYFTDGLNPPRYVKLDDIDFYYEEDEPCEESTPACLQCDKMKIFRPYNRPCITPSVIQSGGNLKAGTYEATIAYCTADGQEISDYHAITNPVPIFDINNRILAQPNLDYETNFSISFEVKDLDTNFNYFKLSVARRIGLDSAASYHEVGIYPITTSNVILNSLEGTTQTSLPEILNRRPIYKTSRGLEAGNGYLFQFGMGVQREINLQPVVNLIGGFAKWVSYQVDEEVYQDGVNVSKYAGFMRDEVYPFGIKFYAEGGFETALMPFIARPPRNTDLIEYVDENGDVLEGGLNTESIVENTPNCVSNGRRLKWQFENTAEVDGPCLTPVDVEGVEYEKEEFLQCTVRDNEDNIDVVETVASGQIIIPEGQNLISFINNNREDILNFTDPAWNDIIDALSEVYPDKNCTVTFPDNCGDPQLEENIIFAIEADDIEEVDVPQPIADYTPLSKPNTCGIFIQDPNTLTPQIDTTFVTNFMDAGEEVYKRTAVPNGTCLSAITLQDPSLPSQGYHLLNMGQIGSDSNLVTTIDASPSGSIFRDKLHANAVWFKIDLGSRDKAIFYMSAFADCIHPDDNNGSQIRISFYEDCSGTHVPSYTQFISNLNNSLTLELDSNDFSSGEVFIAIDSEILNRNLPPNDVFTLRPPCSCFRVAESDEVTSKEIEFTNLKFGKRQLYKAVCTYTTPELQDCEPVPYEKGEFAYWESNLKYPCNPELWDSSTLEITPDDIPVEYRDEFEDKYVDSIVSGVYVLNADVDFQDKPIRHYKFPDSTISPFMNTQDENPGSFQNSIVYPIGFQIDNEVISTFLDIAVKNGLITLEERQSIKRYEIFRGSRTSNKSIIAKGIVFDYYKYEDVNATTPEEIHYANYPLNTLGSDRFNGNIEHPYSDFRNHLYAFHSPDTHFYKPTLPPEMKLEGYMFGASSTIFDEVRDHPRFTVLGQRARNLAATLAGAEIAFEIYLQLSEWSTKGFNNPNPAGSFQAAVFVATQAVALTVQSAYKWGGYRQRWEDSFFNLGKPNQFAYYSVSIGHYNFLRNSLLQDHRYRALASRQYVREGRWRLQNQTGQPQINLNNVQRENHVMLNLAEDFALDHPTIYKNFDNYDTNGINATRVEGLHPGTGKSEGIERRTAVPYVSLKNYFPSQYGTIDSITWLGTNYCGDLIADQEDCSAAFGGDVYISRFSVKRKFPFFLTTAHRKPDNTPFEYSRYFNIPISIGTQGVQEPSELAQRFYVNHLINSQVSGLGSIVFPSSTSDYELDFPSPGNVFYERPPSKFYIYSYGIPHFLVESEYNCNFRYAGTTMAKDFYPHQNDVIELTQQSIAPIQEKESFLINDVYFLNKTLNPFRRLPINYEKEIFDRIADLRNTVIWSKIDSSESELIDPWLIYRALDSYDFDVANGKLIDISVIENEQLLARFRNGFSVFGAVDQIADRFQTETPDLGAGGLFRGRNFNFYKTKLGYAGTQNVVMVSCKYGHFWADAKRGQVFMLQPSRDGSMPQEITQGLQKWFKEQLPFKALTIPGFTENDIDNPYNGVGLTMGWDERFDRVFLTKKDYRLKDGVEDLNYRDGRFFIGEDFNCEDDNIIRDPELTNNDSSWNEIPVSSGVFNGDGSYEIQTSPSYTGSFLSQRSLFTQGECYVLSMKIFMSNFEPTQPMSVTVSAGGVVQTFDTYNEEIEVNMEIPSATNDLLTITFIVDGEVSETAFKVYDICAIPCGEEVEVSFDDEEYFEDCSWTVAYNPLTQSWISYYSFKPNYYIGFNNYFQTGINDLGGGSLWSHLPFSSSYQVFYGERHPFTVEYPIINKGTRGVLDFVEYWLDVRKYYNKHNFSSIKDNGFNKVVVHKNDQNTGQLELVKQNNNDLSQVVNYPIHELNNTKILQTDIGGKWTFNFLYDRIRDKESGLPLWIYDCPNVEKELDHRLIDYRSKFSNRLIGDWFLVKLTQDINSRFKYILRYGFEQRNLNYQ